MERDFNRAYTAFLGASRISDVDIAGKQSMALFLATQLVRTKTMRDTVLGIMERYNLNCYHDPNNSSLLRAYETSTTNEEIKLTSHRIDKKNCSRYLYKISGYDLDFSGK